MNTHWKHHEDRNHFTHFVVSFACISPRMGLELTNVAVASPEAFLALALVLVWLRVGAGAPVLAGLVVAAVI